MARGGKRLGAGRTKGAPNKANFERQAKIAAGGMTPLDIMIENMRHAHAQAEQAEAELTEDRIAELAHSENPFKAILDEVKKALNYRKVAQQCAADVAPYVHPKLAAIEHSGNPEKPVIHRTEVVFVSAGEK